MRNATVFVIVLCLTALLAAAPLKKADVRYAKDVPVLIKGLTVPLKADTASVEKFVKNEFFPQFNLGKEITLLPFKTATIGGTAIFKYAHSYKGWPVEGSFTTVSVKKGNAYRINNGLGRIDIDLSTVVPAATAVKAAMAKHFTKMPAVMPKHMAEKVIMHIGGGVYMPAYKIRFMPTSLADSRIYYVNAKSGKFIKSFNHTLYADDDTLLSDDDPVVALDTAKVYEKNPITTPTLTEVTLPWVAEADDADLATADRGFLTAKMDSDDIRKLKAYNCPNTGELLNLQEVIGYPISIPICSPIQLANKIDNGSFVYEDCEAGKTFVEANMTEEKIDKCAEIAMYYHTSKIYQYLRQLDMGFDYLSGTAADAPLNVIGNFQLVDMNDTQAIMNGTAKLAPMDNAFFSPDNPMMAQLFAARGVKGDLLVFGQGSFADFGFDGDVIYHEFGHASVYTTGLDSAGFLDQYGMNGEPGALHEGLGDTFSFFMSGDPCTGEYASKGIIDWAASQGGTVAMDKDPDGNWCMRYAEHEYKVIDDFQGEVHWDGQPMLAANWAIWKLAQEKALGADAQAQKDNFVKLIFKTLYALGTAQGTYKLWGETLLAEVDADDVYKTVKTDIAAILDNFNFLTEIRARDVSSPVALLYQDAAVDPEATASPLGGGGVAIQVTEDETPVSIAPGYLQLVYTIPEDFEFTALRIVATVNASGGSSPIGGASGTPDFHVYAKKTTPIIYTIDSESATAIAVSVDYDMNIEKDAGKNAYYITDVKPGDKYYFQFVNYGFGGATLTGITVAGENYTTGGDDDDIIIGGDEDEITDTVIVPDTDTTTKKKDDGCGCSVIF